MEFGNRYPCMGPARNSGGVKPDNGTPNLPHDKWISKDNIDINKQQKDLHRFASIQNDGIGWLKTITLRTFV